MSEDNIFSFPYEPPVLYIREEVELRPGGYHTLNYSYERAERDWSEPYHKSGSATYRDRVVLVPFPPKEKL